jgi:hypothetical protein
MDMEWVDWAMVNSVSEVDLGMAAIMARSEGII